MSLHTSEVPISDDLGPGGLQSLPVPSPLSPGDHAVVMQAPEFSSLDTDDGKATKAGGELCHEHKRLLSRWSGGHSGIFNAAAVKQTEATVISVFLAFLEIFSFQVTARKIPGFSDIPAPAIAAMDFFSFSGLAFILIGAVFALISARALCKTAKEFNITHKKFRSCDVTRLPGSKCCDIPNDLGRLLHIMDRSLDTNLGEFIVNTGFAFFLLSFCILLIMTLGVAMWAIVMVLVIWLAVQLFSDPRIWEGLPIISDIAREILWGVV